MSKEDFERLLAGFREGWTKVGHRTFNLEVFTPSFICIGSPDPSQDHPPFDRDKYELLTEICVPCDPEHKHFTNMGFAVLPRDSRIADVTATFKQLSQEAGAALPAAFRDQLAEYCPWHVAQPAGWWVALLLHLTDECARWPDGRPRNNPGVPRPFLCSVDAIEMGGLNTDTPCFPCNGADSTPPTGQAWQGEGVGAAGSAPRQSEITSGAAREAVLRQLEPADRKAYFACQYAESKAERQLQDREAYQLLQDEGIPTDKGDLGELEGYVLPSFDTWAKQLRNARKPLGEQKYTQRAGRQTGGSIAKANEIERDRE